MSFGCFFGSLGIVSVLFSKRILKHVISFMNRKSPEGIEFTGWIQNPKKNYWNTKSINQNKKFLKKKTVFRTLKVGRDQKYARTEFEGLTQNPKKNYKNIKSTNQNEIFTKKVCLLP
jgi:hypothetical protein